MRVVPLGVMAATAMALAGGATAATISHDGPGEGTSIALDSSDFASSGPCGSGGSVVEDGCSVLLKEEIGADPLAYGRFAPENAGWIDSQDLEEVTWTVENDTPFTSLTFALTDASDQENSFFHLSVDGASWSIEDEQRANGTLDWVTVTFDEAVTEASLMFQTRYNDGWGVRAASVATVPVPASGVMLAFGLAGLAATRRRRR